MCRPYAIFYHCNCYSHTRLQRCRVSLDENEGALCEVIGDYGRDASFTVACLTCSERPYDLEYDRYGVLEGGDVIIDDSVEATFGNGEDEHYGAGDDMEGIEKLDKDGDVDMGADGDVGMGDDQRGSNGDKYESDSQATTAVDENGNNSAEDYESDYDSDASSSSSDSYILDTRATGGKAATTSNPYLSPTSIKRKANLPALTGRVALISALRGELGLQDPEDAANIDPRLLAYDEERAARLNRPTTGLSMKGMEEEVGVMKMMGLDGGPGTVERKVLEEDAGKKKKAVKKPVDFTMSLAVRTKK